MFLYLLYLLYVIFVGDISMNIKEWKLVCENNTADHTWDCKSRAIQKSLVYNSNPEATTRHHLMDTPE